MIKSGLESPTMLVLIATVFFVVGSSCGDFLDGGFTAGADGSLARLRRAQGMLPRELVQDIQAYACETPEGPVTQLEAGHIVRGVKQHAAQLEQCRASLGPPSTLDIRLDWYIEPDGYVTEPLAWGPGLSPQWSSCIELAVTRWCFPTSETGAPVRNYPIGAALGTEKTL